MRILKRVLFLAVFVCLTAQASSLRVSELFVNGSLKKLESVGFKNPSLAKEKLELMFQDIYPQGRVSAESLEMTVRDLARENDFFKKLEKVLKQDANAVSFNDIEDAFVHSVMISHVKGKNLVCADACSLGAKSSAEKVSVVKLSDPNLISIQNKLAKMGPVQKRKLLMKGLGGSLPGNLGPLEQKQLAFFLLMAKSRSKIQRNYVEVVKRLVKASANKNLLTYGANFHKIPSNMDNLSDKELLVYTQMIEMVLVKKSANPETNLQDAFYSSLDDVIKDSNVSSEARVALKQTKEEMQRKNCLFN